MESSSPSEKVSDLPSHRWANVLGTTIAVLTLTLPLFAIAYFSSDRVNLQPPTPSYSLIRQGN